MYIHKAHILILTLYVFTLGFAERSHGCTERFMTAILTENTEYTLEDPDFSHLIVTLLTPEQKELFFQCLGELNMKYDLSSYKGYDGQNDDSRLFDFRIIPVEEKVIANEEVIVVPPEDEEDITVVEPVDGLHNNNQNDTQGGGEQAANEEALINGEDHDTEEEKGHENNENEQDCEDEESNLINEDILDVEYEIAIGDEQDESKGESVVNEEDGLQSQQEKQKVEQILEHIEQMIQHIKERYDPSDEDNKPFRYNLRGSNNGGSTYNDDSDEETNNEGER